MKKVSTIVIAIGLLLLPLIVYAQSEQKSTGPPPVAQPLVREGDLAIKLVGALKVGAASNEAEAENMLGSVGIAPKNGWIADYPVTPDVIGELQKAVSEAADAKKLPMERQEALKVFRTATVEAGLPIVAEIGGNDQETQPPKSYEYTSSAAVDNYYDEEGPPVITYYPPPWDYGYLYSWVPYPFFFGGFFFSGFFALHDFHRVHIFANRVVVFSNHFISPINRTVVVIDPRTRATGRTFTSASFTGRTITSRSAWQRTGTAGFASASTRRAATSIVERSQQRLGAGGFTRTTGGTRQFSTGRVAPSMTGRTMGANQGRTLSNTMNQRSTGAGGRSFSGPSMSRTFGSSENSGRSFSRQSESFGTPSGSRSSGGFSAAHSFGGFSGGHSFSGGFSGGGGGFHGGGHR